MLQSIIYEILEVMPLATDPNLTLFSSLCTIQLPSGNFGATGAPDGVFVNTSDMGDVPCLNATPSIARVQATEAKALAEIASKGFRHVLLNGWYPQLLSYKANGQVRAVIDGVNYEVLGAESDSQGTQTRFEAQLVTV